MEGKPVKCTSKGRCGACMVGNRCIRQCDGIGSHERSGAVEHHMSDVRIASQRATIEEQCRQGIVETDKSYSRGDTGPLHRRKKHLLLKLPSRGQQGREGMSRRRISPYTDLVFSLYHKEIPTRGMKICGTSEEVDTIRRVRLDQRTAFHARG